VTIQCEYEVRHEVFQIFIISNIYCFHDTMYQIFIFTLGVRRCV
jgi:hypothetical protein